MYFRFPTHVPFHKFVFKCSEDFLVSKQDTIAVFSRPEKRFASKERVFTGSQSLKLSKKDPNGCTLRIFKIAEGDKIIASCRTTGYDGYMTVQEFPNGIGYSSCKIYAKRDYLGWKYNECQFIMPHKLPDSTELRVFLFFPGKDSMYMDDIRIRCLGKDL